MDRPDNDDQMGAPDLEEPIEVFDDEEVSDEEEARVIAEYGLDEPDELEEEDTAGGSDDPDGDPAPPDDAAGPQVSDDPEEPAPAEEEGAAVGTEGEPPPAAAATDGAAAAPAADAEGGADEEITAWEFTTDGRKVEVPGSMVFTAQMPDGSRQKMVTMPLAAVDRHLRPYLADRPSMRKNTIELMRKLAGAEEQVKSHPSILEANKVVSVLDQLLEITDEDALIEHVTKLRADREEWRRQAEIRSRDEQIRAMKEVAPPPDEVLDQLEREEQAEQLRSVISKNVDAIFADPEFKAVAPYIGREDFIAELEEHQEKVFFVADLEGASEEERAAAEARGIRHGEVVVDLGYIKSRLRRETTRANRVRESIQKRRQAEENNRRRLAGGNGGKKKEDRQPAPARVAATAEQPSDYEAWKEDFLGDVGGPVIID